MSNNKKTKPKDQQLKEKLPVEDVIIDESKLKEKLPVEDVIIDESKLKEKLPVEDVIIDESKLKNPGNDIKAVVMTNLTKNPIELVGVDPRVKQLILPGCMVRVPTEKYHELMKNPMVRRWIDNEIIRCSDHGIAEDLNNRASVEKAPAHLTSDVIVGESKASVEKFGVVGNINPENL